MNQPIGWKLVAAKVVESNKVEELLKEANELTAIIAASRKTAKNNR
jgi:hypothetical protein